MILHLRCQNPANIATYSPFDMDSPVSIFKYKTNTTLIILVLIFSLYPFCSIIAQDSSITYSPDRPGMATGPTVLPRYSLDIETGMGYDYLFESPLKMSTYNLNDLLIRVNLLKNMELRIQTNLSTMIYDSNNIVYKKTEMNPPDIGLKFHFLKNSGIIPEAAILLNLSLPYDKQYHEPMSSAFLLMQHQLTGNSSVTWNFGGVWDYNNYFTGFYAVCLNISISDNFGFFVEDYGFTTFDSPLEHYGDMGLFWMLTEKLQLDLSGGLRIHEDIQNYSCSFGLSWLIHK